MSRPTRVTFRQKTRMLKFMKTHTRLATGRLSGLSPDGARRRVLLLNELATVLNGIEDGAHKTPDKWYKTWQDWKSDIKAKARKIKTYSGGDIRGPPPPPLVPLEQEVLDFIGPGEVEGCEVPDPLKVVQIQRDRSRSPGPSCLELPRPPEPEVEVEFESERERFEGERESEAAPPLWVIALEERRLKYEAQSARALTKIADLLEIISDRLLQKDD